MHIMGRDSLLRVLLIDDSQAQYTLIQTVLETLFSQVTLDWAIDSREGLVKLLSGRYDVALVDYELGDGNGLDIIQSAVGQGVSTPCILLTAKGSRDLDMAAMNVGAADYIDKGELKPHILERTLRYTLQHQRLLEQARELSAAAERQKLARDLHDAVSQTLFSASVIAESLPHLFQSDLQAVADGLHQLTLLNKGALAEMRNLLTELRPKAILETPLADLIRNLLTALETRLRANIHYRTNYNTRLLLPPNVQITFYRIAQEALNNVTKYAEAEHIAVELLVEADGRISLHVRDDGRGFDPRSVGGLHHGLNIMRERAEQIGASWSIESEPGEGTQISLTWSERSSTP